MSIVIVDVAPNDPNGSCGNNCREGQCCGNGTCFCPVINEQVLIECEGEFKIKYKLKCQGTMSVHVYMCIFNTQLLQ